MMPFTNNIAYGFIGGLATWLICKFVTFQIHPIQCKWPGYPLFKRWTVSKSMQVRALLVYVNMRGSLLFPMKSGQNRCPEVVATCIRAFSLIPMPWELDHHLSKLIRIWEHKDSI